jgi:hypothetical protein
VGFSIKTLGRMVDPTSKSSPLGGVARAAISQVPGGAAALEAINAGRGMIPKKPAAAAAPAAPAATTEPAPKPGVVGWFKQLSTVAKVGLGAGVALVLFLVVKMVRK